jgi:hypothetical protein
MKKGYAIFLHPSKRSTCKPSMAETAVAVTIKARLTASGSRKSMAMDFAADQTARESRKKLSLVAIDN